MKLGRWGAALQAMEKLWQGWRLHLQTVAVLLLDPAIQNLFLHNNHWKDKHMVIVWLCGIVRQGQLKQWARGQAGEVWQGAKGKGELWFLPI